MRFRLLSFLGLLFVFGGLVFVGPVKVVENRSYFYDGIDVEAVVNQDTTVDIRERQSYVFVGEYHKGWRSIPLRKIDAITNIQVLDGVTNQPLTYSWRTLEKTDPASWGKYTYRRNGGNVEIEWYYNAKDEQKTWIIEYKAHGALEFLKDNDRFYWNLFTDYEVPVEAASVKVYLPENANLSVAGWEIYPSGGVAAVSSFDSSQGYFYASGENFPPQGMLTVNLFWPKGAVNRSAYWSDFWKLKYGYIISIFLLILTFSIAIIRWLMVERLVKGRGTIVPQYEPPKGMSPAEMQVVLKESVNSRALAATIIDLAVRGYVKIEEEPPTAWHKMLAKATVGLFAAIFILLFIGIWYFGSGNSISLFFVAVAALICFIILQKFKTGRYGRDYRIVKTEKDNSGLKDYEKKYLDALFWYGSEYFSTREMRSSSSSSRAAAMQKNILELREDIYKSVDPDNKFYEVSPLKEKIKWGVWILSGIIIVICLSAGGSWFFSLAQYWYIVFSLVIFGSCLFVYFKYEARLSQAGRELKEEILGFKMYLYSAERYRLQNLTPDIFEKYLPYAMVFKIEKQWAKTFVSRDVSQPSWYYTGYYGSDSSVPSVATFSATAFSASFVSSFPASFSGWSGGGWGGFWGGGGGGGGGGAS